MNHHSPAVQQDLARYNAAMEKSLDDKLFFLAHTAGAMTFVDFGCANGAVLKAISERRANKTLIGIDINPMQRAICERKVPNGVFASDFEMVRGMVEASEGPRVAIFSSVLHEDPYLLDAPTASGLFDYVVIRDTAITSTMATTQVPPAWIEKVALKAPEVALKVWTQADKGLANMAAFTEFLLKYPYLTDNQIQTQRELTENYPMIGVEGITDSRDTDWAAIHFEHFSAPWVVDRVRQDFGFEFPFPTHFKLILKKVTA